MYSKMSLLVLWTSVFFLQVSSAPQSEDDQALLALIGVNPTTHAPRNDDALLGFLGVNPTADAPKNDDSILASLGINPTADAPRNGDEFLDVVSKESSKDIDRLFYEALQASGAIPQTPNQIPNDPFDSSCICVKKSQCNRRKDKESGVVSVSGIGDFVDLRVQSRLCKDPFEVCCEQLQKSIADTPITQEKQPCGKRNAIGLNVRFLGFPGDQAQYAEFPWTVAVFKDESVNGILKDSLACGGALIHPQVVLTVGHCVDTSRSDILRVRVGEWNLNSSSESYPHKDIGVREIVVHPQFTRTHLEYNSALLILNEAAPNQPNINTVCLPSPNDQWDTTDCHSSGWGKKAFGSNEKYPQVMKKVLLPVVDRNVCTQVMRQQLPKLQNFQLHESSLCAGANGRDTCTGDGGSPLVCKKTNDKNKYVQIGLVAWGLGCNKPGVPGVYTSIESIIGWVTDNVVSRFGQNAVEAFTN